MGDYKSGLEYLLEQVRAQIRSLQAVETAIIKESPGKTFVVGEIKGGRYRRGQVLDVQSMREITDADVGSSLEVAAKGKPSKPKISIAEAAKVVLGKSAPDGLSTNDLLDKLGSVVGGKKPAATLYAVLTRNRTFFRGTDYKWRLA